MARIYAGDLREADRIAGGFRAPGYETVADATPEQPGTDDLALIHAAAGITSSFRHALNNPLTAVLGFAELLLRRSGLDPEVSRKVLQIQENALRIRQMLIESREADGS